MKPVRAIGDCEVTKIATAIYTSNKPMRTRIIQDRYRGGDFLGFALVSESRTKKMLKQVQHDSGFWQVCSEQCERNTSLRIVPIIQDSGLALDKTKNIVNNISVGHTIKDLR